MTALIRGTFAGWGLVTLLWSVGLSLSIARLNAAPVTDWPGLLLFFAGAYAICLLPVALLSMGFTWAVRRRGASARRAAVHGAGLTVGVLVVVNLLLRWAVAHRLTLPIVTPMGAFDAAALLLAFALFALGLERLTREPLARPARGRGAAMVAAAAVLLIVTHVANVAYERPYRVDLHDRVAPIIGSDPKCVPTSAPVAGVTVLALDGMTWSVITPLIQQGKLPNLRRLLKRSAYGFLDTLPTSYSPVVWATIATGLGQERHGISGFLRFVLPGVATPIHRGPLLSAFTWWGGANAILDGAASLDIVRPEPQPSQQMREHALWHVAGANGHLVGVYDWMNTWPVEQVEGYIYTDVGEPPRNAYPDSVQKTVGEAIERYDREVTDSRDLLSNHERHYVAALALYERWLPSFSVNFNKVMDNLHAFWVDVRDPVFVDPESPPYYTFRDPVLWGYLVSDQWIGRFMKVIPEDHVIAIVSDHGFEFNGTHHAHAPPGVVILSGGPFACGKVIEGADVFDIAPTLLALLGLPGLEDMPGHVLSEALAEGQHLSLERIEAYPDDWREKAAPLAPAGQDEWDELREKLEALGYVN